MYLPDGIKDNDYNSDNTIILTEFTTGTRIHEHDLISVKTKKEQTSIIICSTCGLVYCDKCGNNNTISTSLVECNYAKCCDFVIDYLSYVYQYSSS